MKFIIFIIMCLPSFAMQRAFMNVAKKSIEQIVRTAPVAVVAANRSLRDFERINRQVETNFIYRPGTCPQRYRSFVKKTKQDMFAKNGVTMVIHVTDCDGVSLIKKIGKLVPGNMIGKANYYYKFDGRAQGNTNVFLSLSHADNLEKTIAKTPKNKCIMVFDPMLLRDYQNDYHIARGWVYGNRYSDSVDGDGNTTMYYADGFNHSRVNNLLKDLNSDGIMSQNEIVLRRFLPLEPYLLRVVRGTMEGNSPLPDVYQYQPDK